MLRKLLGTPVLLLALGVELLLLAVLISDQYFYLNEQTWLIFHVLASLLATIAISSLVVKAVPGRRLPLILLLFCVSLSIPFAGALGMTLALAVGATLANGKHRTDTFWRYTRNADLPYTAPLNRPHRKLDSRGFIEQLMFERDTDEIYKKVLASRSIRNTESAAILKTAVGHANERIRLTAFQAMDKKVSLINREIQRLEQDAERSHRTGKSNTYLQISNNYWELLTLEEDEPVARAQLLEKSAAAAIKAVSISPKSINAHFSFGRISLQQGHHKRATAAFEHAIKLGMPKDKVLPYLAESAFAERDFGKVRKSLNSMDDAFKAYPPLRQIAEFWA